MNSSELTLRERLARIAEERNYKRLAKAVEEGSLSSVISELMKYQKRDEIIAELFKDSFFWVSGVKL